MWNDLQELLLYSGISKQDIEFLDLHKEKIENIVATTLVEFDKHLRSSGYAHQFINTDSEILNKKRVQHMLTLFRGKFDRVVASNAEHVGRAHLAHGISRKSYIQGYSYITREIVGQISADPELSRREIARTIDIVLNLIFIDIIINLETDHVVFVD